VHIEDEHHRFMEWKRTNRLADCGGEERCYVLERNHASRSIRLTFGDSVHGKAPRAGSIIRMIASDPVKEELLWVGASNGLPDQLFDISRAGIFQQTGMRLIVAERDQASGEIKWADWQQV